MIDSAGQLLGQIGISIEVAQCNSDGATTLVWTHRGSLLMHLGRSHGTLATCFCGDHTPGQAAKPLYGWSRRLRTSAITRYYPYDRAMTAVLIALEVGHVLGVMHHTDGYICEEGSSL
jgi:hypothetical protein